MGYKLLSEAGIERNVFAIEAEAIGSMNAPVSMYVTAEEADHTAKMLSKLMPGCVVKLVTLSRIKAIYQDGNRGEVSDYHKFYSNLSDEEYRATKIKDSKTAEWL